MDAFPPGLERQSSMLGFSGLPDFGTLLESLCTPTLKLDFDFTLGAQEEDACSTPTGITRRLLQSVQEAANSPDSSMSSSSNSDDQTLSEQLHFDSNIIESSFYHTESQQLKNLKLVEVPASHNNRNCNNNISQFPIAIKQEYTETASLSPCSYTSSVSSPQHSNMGIDSELESNSQLATAMRASFNIDAVKMEPDSGEEFDSEREDGEKGVMEELTKKMNRCCHQLNIPRGKLFHLIIFFLVFIG